MFNMTWVFVQMLLVGGSKAESVTYVSGTPCYVCLGPLTRLPFSQEGQKE